MKLANEMCRLVDLQGVDLRARDANPHRSPLTALARLVATRVPEGATVAVLGSNGGKPALAAISPHGEALYFFEPLPFDGTKQQNASATFRVVPIDKTKCSVESTSRWWGELGTDGVVNDWRFKIGNEELKFSTEWDPDEKVPADEAFAIALCTAAGLPVSAATGEAFAAAA